MYKALHAESIHMPNVIDKEKEKEKATQLQLARLVEAFKQE
jgi:hypothetical protein